MSEQTITLSELSKKIELNPNALRIYLCRLSKYEVTPSSYQYRYKYNYYLLSELKTFLLKKMYSRNGCYFSKYHKVIENINKLLKEM